MGSSAHAQVIRDNARFINVQQMGATPDDATDDTKAIQAAIDRADVVYIPVGVYLIDPVVGLRVRTGTRLYGDGRALSILQAMPGGGTIEDLAAYRRGSIIRRAFDSMARNPYVTDVRISDLAIVLNHPADSATRNAIQIGLDLRNIGRSLIERVWVGNIPPGPANGAARYQTAFVVQGYGIVLGTVGSSDKAYAGGEVNTIRDCTVWGAYKLIVIDDAVLSPLSGAHATLIDRCDVQGGHHLISQESEYGAGNRFRDNIAQNVIVAPGNRTKTTVFDIGGYDNVIDGGYVETGEAASYALRLGPQSHHNRVTFQHLAKGRATTATDDGRCNQVSGVVIAKSKSSANCAR